MKQPPPGAVEDSALVLLDTPAFIYFFERHARYRAAALQWFERIASGGLAACASVLMLAELLVPHYRAGDASAARELAETVRFLAGLEVFPVSARVAEGAARLRAQYNLHTPDAIHAATALAAGAAWIVTNDRRLRRIEPEGVKVWLFDDHVQQE